MRPADVGGVRAFLNRFSRFKAHLQRLWRRVHDRSDGLPPKPKKERAEMTQGKWRTSHTRARAWRARPTWSLLFLATRVVGFNQVSVVHRCRDFLKSLFQRVVWFPPYPFHRVQLNRVMGVLDCEVAERSCSSYRLSHTGPERRIWGGPTDTK